MQYVIVGIGGQGILFSSRVLGHTRPRQGGRVIAAKSTEWPSVEGSVISHFKVGDYNSPLVKANEADVPLCL